MALSQEVKKATPSPIASKLCFPSPVWTCGLLLTVSKNRINSSNTAGQGSILHTGSPGKLWGAQEQDKEVLCYTTRTCSVFCTQAVRLILLCSLACRHSHSQASVHPTVQSETVTAALTPASRIPWGIVTGWFSIFHNTLENLILQFLGKT